MGTDLDAKVGELQERLQTSEHELQRSAEAGLRLVNELEELKSQLAEAERQKVDAVRQNDDLQKQLHDKDAEINTILKESFATRRGHRGSNARGSIMTGMMSRCDSTTPGVFKLDSFGRRRRRASSGGGGRRASTALMPQPRAVGENAPMSSVEALEDEIIDLSEHNSELQEELERLHEENQKLEALVKEVRAEAEAEQARIIEQMKSQEREEDSVSRKTAFSSKMWEASSRAQKEKMEKEIETLTSEQTELTEKHAETLASNKQLRLDLEAQLEAVETANCALVEKETEVGRLHCRVSSLEEELRITRETLSETQETVAEEQRKRVADKGGKSRMVTYALSEQMVPSDDEEEEEEEDGYSQKSLEAIIRKGLVEVAASGEESMERTSEKLQEARMELLKFFCLDEESCFNPSANGLHIAHSTLPLHKEVDLLRGDVQRVLQLSSKCRELLSSILERDPVGMSFEPECVSAEEEARHMRERRESRQGLTKSMDCPFLELHIEVSRKCEQLYAEVKSLYEECEKLRAEPEEEIEELSWFERLQQTLSCGSRGGRRPVKTQPLAREGVVLEGSSENNG